MPVTYLIQFDVIPEQRASFLSLLGGVLDAMRSEATFHEATLHRDPQNENRFLLYETWQDHAEVLEVQLQRPYRDAFHSALPTVLRQPRDVSIWVPLRADRASGLQERQ
jgi:quinol monooxygenase YgiN